MKPPIYPKLHPLLSHLSKEQREELYIDYYKLDVPQIIERYQLNRKSNIHKIFEPKVLQEECEYCGTQLWEFYPPKNGQNYSVFKSCPACSHEIYYCDALCCICDYCLKKREQERIRKYNEIYKPYKKLLDNQTQLILKYETLSFEDKIFLLTYIFSQPELCNDMFQLDGYKRDQKFSPTKSFTQKIVKSLFNKGILKIKLDVDLIYVKQYIDFDEVEQFIKFNLLEINIQDFEQYKLSLLSDIKYRSKQNIELLLSIWRKIAIHECSEFYLTELTYINCKSSVSESISDENLFQFMLNHFSVSQIQNVLDIFSGQLAKDCLAKKLSINSFGFALKEKVDIYIRKAAYENLNIPNLPFNKRLNPSLLSVIVLNHIISSEQNWTETIIDKAILEKY